MDKFSDYINSLSEEKLRSELTKLHFKFSSVREYYKILLTNENVVDETLSQQYKEEIKIALYPNKYLEGGLDIKRIKEILFPLTGKYYVEIGLFSVEECSNIAKELGGDFEEDFYMYFEDLFEEIVKYIIHQELLQEYREELIMIATSAIDIYNHSHELQEILRDYKIKK